MIKFNNENTSIHIPYSAVSPGDYQAAAGQVILDWKYV